MNYVEIVVEAIKDKGYTVTKNPYKAKLKKECDNQVFLGNCLEFEYNTSWGMENIKFLYLIMKTGKTSIMVALY